jgi:hypothetical protein
MPSFTNVWLQTQHIQQVIEEEAAKPLEVRAQAHGSDRF